jgi:hypothetical protein
MVTTPPPCCCHFRTMERTVFVSCAPSGSPMSSFGVDFAVAPRLEERGVAGDGIGISRIETLFSWRVFEFCCHSRYSKLDLLTVLRVQYCLL